MDAGGPMGDGRGRHGVHVGTAALDHLVVHQLSRMPAGCGPDDHGRLELDDVGGILDEFDPPSDVVDLDDPKNSVSWFLGLRRADAWACGHKVPVAVLVGLIAFCGTVCSSAPAAAPPTSAESTLARPSASDARDVSSAWPRRVADQGHAPTTTFRDPGTGGIVIAYTPSSAVLHPVPG